MTVTVTRSKDENRDNVWKMKSCPTAPHAPNASTSFNARGCRARKDSAEESSEPVDSGMGIGRNARMGFVDEM